MDDRERLLKVELIMDEIRKSMEKILESQEYFTTLKIEIENSKVFRKDFDSNVRKIVEIIIASKNFEKEIDKQIEEKVLNIFNKPEVREDFDNKVKEIFKDEWKNIQLSFIFKVLAWVVPIVSSLVIGIVKGVE